MSDKTETPEVEDLIRYDILAQEALRGVVKKVLHEVARTGLPGEHHFYITFDTQFAGVRMSSRMRDKYPEEITIVVQHQYWDLEANDNNFSIGLSFDNVPETMVVPFAAVRGFFDPSVQFGLQFDVVVSDQFGDTDSNSGDDADNAGDANISALPSPPKLQKIAKDKPAKSADKEKAKEAKRSDEPVSAEVVSLDTFRKK